MTTAPESIFSKQGIWDILGRLAMIQADAEIEKVAIPEGTVRQLFAVLEARFPEVSLAIEEIPAGALTTDGIEWVLRATEDAVDGPGFLSGSCLTPYFPHRFCSVCTEI